MRTNAVLASLMLFGLLGTGTANAGITQCQNGQACVWRDGSYSGKFRGMTLGANNYTGITWSDGSLSVAQASSVRNQGNNCDIRFYKGINQTGDNMYFDRVVEGFNYQDPNLTNGGGSALGRNYTSNFDNSIRSHGWTNC